MLAQLYRALAADGHRRASAGPPTYDMEIWLASALLAVTFPFLIFFAEFFKFWPLAKSRINKSLSFIYQLRGSTSFTSACNAVLREPELQVLYRDAKRSRSRNRFR